jgi:phage pi2 protein 07
MKIEDVIVSDKIYEEIKTTAIKLWCTHDNQHGYVTEKVDLIKDLPNSASNVLKIIKMFDHWHQRAIKGRISSDAIYTIKCCIKHGNQPQTIGQDFELNAFFKV